MNIEQEFCTDNTQTHTLLHQAKNHPEMDYFTDTVNAEQTQQIHNTSALLYNAGHFVFPL